MTELIVAPASKDAAVQALAAGLPDADWINVNVSSKRPDDIPGVNELPHAFIRVTRSGGGMLNRVTDRASLLVECWHDGGRSEALANAAIGVLARAAGQRQRHAGAFLRGMDNVFGPTDFPDPLTPDHDRSQFTADLLVSTN